MLRLPAFLFFLAMFSMDLTTAQTPVHVSIYYESLCPDSVKFITKQFYPTWEKMMKYMEVEFIPFGNANITKEKEFECQHGPAECYGNKVQACAIGLLDNVQKVKFVNCVMSATNSTAAGSGCATEPGSYGHIEACASGEDGTMALEKMGLKTKMLSPPLKSVPTIVFNNKYMQEEQEKIMNDFLGALCSHLAGAKPSECAGNSAASSQLAALSSLAALGLFALLVR